MLRAAVPARHLLALRSRIGRFSTEPRHASEAATAHEDTSSSTSTPPKSSKANRKPGRLVAVEVKKWGEDMAPLGVPLPPEKPKLVEVQGGLPGETVMAWVKRHKSYVDSVEKASPDRVTPFCPHEAECSGCSMQFLSDEGQAREKQDHLVKQFSQRGLSVEKVLPPILGPTKGYRSKARLSVVKDRFADKMFVGFTSKKGFVVEMRECPTLKPALGSRQFLDELYGMAGDMSIKDQLPQVEVVVDDVGRRGMVLRHLSPLTPQDQRRLAQFALATQTTLFTQSGGPDTIKPLPQALLDSANNNTTAPEPTGTQAPSSSSSPSSLSSPHFEWHVNIQASPPAELEHPANSSSQPAQPAQPHHHQQRQARTFYFRADITNFVQINREINDKLVMAVLDELALRPDDVVLDLFCGLGNFTVPIAAQSASQGRLNDLGGLTVLGVDNHSAMIDQARRNAVQLNQVNNALFADADLHAEEGVQQTHRGLVEVLAVRRQQARRQQGAGRRQEVKVVIDPPRSGGGAALISAASPLFSSRHPDFIVRKVVYVSCGPKSLARDAEVLVNDFGFKIASTRFVNMFPHTAASESLTVFER